MRMTTALLLGPLLCHAVPATARQKSQSAAVDRALLDKYCVSCHNARLKTAGLSLDKLDAGNVGVEAATWEKVVSKLGSGTMPPTGLPRPDDETRKRFVASLEAALDHAAAAYPNPGRPAIHRLNRAEYANAIRELLGLEIDGRDLLPADDAGYGFDNIADLLKVSPGLLERYLIAATKISRLAIGDPAMRGEIKTYTLPYLTLRQDDRTDEELPFGTRGGLAVKHYFPLDGEYAIKIRLERSQLAGGAFVRGLAEPTDIDVRLDGVRMKVFSIGGGKRPGMDASGSYVEDRSDEDLRLRAHVTAGPHVIGVTFHKKAWYYEGIGVSTLPVGSDGFSLGRDTDHEHGKIEASLSSLEVSGPFNGRMPTESPSRRKIFTCRPTGAKDESACAKRILATLARRAYRRPVTDRDVGLLMTFYDAGRKDGGFELGVQKALERLLVDPEFLFRAERTPQGVAPRSVYQISDLDLASRLSFFIWSAPPDDELVDAAIRGRLKDPATLERQVRRMLHDPRSDALISNFFGQWLMLRNVRVHKPNAVVFHDFDENLRDAFERETELFLASQLREDRSVPELLTANYTFVNERLAKYYGISNVYGSHFRRITLPDGARGGVLGQASLLTLTSYPNRTSPVLRGKWVLENILGTPPPSPPANVPPFPEEEGTSKPTSVRARMEQHRKNPTCAGCHSMLDPLGFALENFNAVGKWRDADAGASIDPSGALPDGTRFSGPSEFRQALLKHKEAFVRTLAQKLLTYALGRGLEHYDMPAVRSIVREAAAGEYRWSQLFVAIARSAPFQLRIAEP